VCHLHPPYNHLSDMSIFEGISSSWIPIIMNFEYIITENSSPDLMKEFHDWSSAWTISESCIPDMLYICPDTVKYICNEFVLRGKFKIVCSGFYSPLNHGFVFEYHVMNPFGLMLCIVIWSDLQYNFLPNIYSCNFPNNCIVLHMYTIKYFLTLPLK